MPHSRKNKTKNKTQVHGFSSQTGQTLDYVSSSLRPQDLRGSIPPSRLYEWLAPMLCLDGGPGSVFLPYYFYLKLASFFLFENGAHRWSQNDGPLGSDCMPSGSVQLSAVVPYA